MGGHTREGLQQRYSFRRVQRRNTIEHLGEGCVERHQSGGKSMGHSCGQNSENAYYGRKAARAVCHLGTRLYIARRSFDIQKLYKTFSNIMISIPLFMT